MGTYMVSTRLIYISVTTGSAVTQFNDTQLLIGFNSFSYQFYVSYNYIYSQLSYYSVITWLSIKFDQLLLSCYSVDSKFLLLSYYSVSTKFLTKLLLSYWKFHNLNY